MSWQERPAKRARLGAMTRPREDRTGGRHLTSGENNGLSSEVVDGMAAAKRSQVEEHPATPKKMRLSLEYGATTSNVLPADPFITSSLPLTRRVTSESMSMIGDFKNKEVGAVSGVNGQGGTEHCKRHQHILFRTRSTSALRGATSSPYDSQITAHQRRTQRRRRDAEARSQQIKNAAGARQCQRERLPEETSRVEEPDGRGLGGEVASSGGARPKECLERGSELSSVCAEGELLDSPGSLTKDEVAPSQGRVSRESCDRSPACSENVNKCEAETQPGECQLLESIPHEEISKSKETESELVGNEELLEQLRNDYADSQAMVRNLRQINDQYAEKIENLSLQMSFLETRHQKEKSRIEARSSELRNLRKEYTEKFSVMSARIETLEKHSSEDQETISEQRDKLETLTARLERATSRKRLARDQLEQLRSTSRQELASQQQTLASCRARLEGLLAGVARQRQCLECSICLSVFCRPVTLGCGHTFCETCIETSRRTAVLPDSCPLCRRHIRVSARSAVIGQLAEITQELQQWHV